jgi:N-carbamoylputrescine amidase
MPNDTLTVALISDVFHEADGAARLRTHLHEAKRRGAELAVLPELPLNPWSPATTRPRADDAEAPAGPRHRLQAEAAREAGINLLGGAIVQDPATGVRRNTALVFSSSGALAATFCKLHLPEERGFWETSHYDPGLAAATPIRLPDVAMPFGVQICSDINRPEGSHLLGAMGAEAILAPRATERVTFDRWRVVFQANALTSAAYVLSVNRPAPEQGVLIGGASIAVDPSGTILLQTLETIGIVTLSRAVVAKARIDYPGYLPVRASLYAHAWNAVAAR